MKLEYALASGDIMRRSCLVLFLLVVATSTAHAQHAGSIALPSTTPAREATQFDFLAGEWSIAAVQRYPGLAGVIHGGPKMAGTWKAHRAFDGFGIEDELRLADGSGNPVLFAAAARVFDATTHRWSVSSLDVYRTHFAMSVAEWRDGQMIVTTTSSDTAKPTVTRMRFFDIKPASFTAWQDRSTDGGKRWEEGRLRMEAKRTRAAQP